jgi:hypothetical protein
MLMSYPTIPDVCVSLPLDEAIEQLSFVKGVLYRDSHDKTIGWMPHYTGNFLSCDCDEYALSPKGRKRTPTGDYSPVWASSLGEFVKYVGG